ncbi:DUF1217 domain-containing protein [Pseudoponticoccus marisrubri]|uniref:Flagellar protein n=1 Tax=Pseudoponticoccus marisrubri TaxID=1685382 RepID=A0A0W7WGB1_9RHOB|nr:DUF1217 domain-containing protein [Pseudoponticoccus marisrubri]KUF09609.1 flagellar protein [Pseudoponticoccus marisrubri]
MTFQPVIVGSGLVGWQFLQATQSKQRAVFDAAPELVRDTDYFASEIRNVTSAEDLVADRRLLRVALGAFGLQDDIDNTFFVRKVLEDGINDPEALANRLTDERYKSLARTFAFDSALEPATQRDGFAADIISRFRAQEFEVAVGNQDESLRLAMNYERSLPEIARASGGDDTKWFRVMGTTPLRNVLETALGLPSGFGQLDIDKQLEMFRDKVNSRFGVKEINDMADPDVIRKVVQTYLLQSQINQTSVAGSGQIALSLLQSIPRQSLLG